MEIKTEEQGHYCIQSGIFNIHVICEVRNFGAFIRGTPFRLKYLLQLCNYINYKYIYVGYIGNVPIRRNRI